MPGRRYRIGEFARLSGTPIRTLRFYDELGLIKPAEVDVRTRYRFYDSSQLQELAAIRALQDLGASLADIRRVLQPVRDERARRRLLERLRSTAKKSIESAQRSLRWIELALEEHAQHLRSVPIVVKQRAGIHVASVRARLGSYDAIDGLERDLRHAIAPEFVGRTRGVLWHRCEASGAIDGEPFIEIDPRVPRSPAYQVKELPRVTVASAFCEANDAAAVHAFAAIDRWVHHHEYRIAGPKRELYLGNLLEVQFPVAAK